MTAITYTASDRSRVMKLAWSEYLRNRWDWGFRMGQGFRGDLFGRAMKKAWAIIRNGKLREAEAAKAAPIVEMPVAARPARQITDAERRQNEQLDHLKYLPLHMDAAAREREIRDRFAPLIAAEKAAVSAKHAA